MKVIYLDVLFLVNFIIDYLLLSLTSYLRGNAARNTRITLSAAVGGLMAAALFFAPSGGLLTLAAKPICCCVTSFAAFGFSDKRKFLGDCAMLCAASFIFSGGIIAVAQLFPDGGGVVNNTSVYFDISMKTLVLGTAAGYFLMSLFCRSGSYKQERGVKAIKCTLRGSDLAFNAFVDSGNMMTEPITGKKVIMVSPSIIRMAVSGDEQRLVTEIPHGNVTDIFEQLAFLAPSCYGVAPFTAVGGKGLLITARPDQLQIDGNLSDNYILGISMDEIETVCGCRALIGG